MSMCCWIISPFCTFCISRYVIRRYLETKPLIFTFICRFSIFVAVTWCRESLLYDAKRDIVAIAKFNAIYTRVVQKNIRENHRKCFFLMEWYFLKNLMTCKQQFSSILFDGMNCYTMPTAERSVLLIATFSLWYTNVCDETFGNGNCYVCSGCILTS